MRRQALHHLAQQMKQPLPDTDESPLSAFAWMPQASQKDMWEAQIKVVFPIIEKQRSIIVERYRNGIEALLPITGAYGEMFFDAEDVEIGVLSHLVSLGRLVVAFEDGKMIARLRNARNTLAHIKPMTQAEIDEIL